MLLYNIRLPGLTFVTLSHIAAETSLMHLLLRQMGVLMGPGLGKIVAGTALVVILAAILVSPAVAAIETPVFFRFRSAIGAAAPARGAQAQPSGGELGAAASPLGDQPYAESSPLNHPISSGAAISPESAQMVQTLLRAEGEKGFVLTVSRWTVPTYLADSGTPLQTVQLRRPPPLWHEPPSYLGFPPGWSGSLNTVLPAAMRGVPIPASARPDPSLDAHMTIIDPGSNCEYDLYGAHKAPGGWQAIWMNSTRLGGTGIYPAGMATTASGFAGNAGLIWPQELRSGHIDHALLFAYPFTKTGGPVWPATSSDGLSNEPGAIPEGARLQLNPNLNLDSLGLPRYERVIAEALQRYGMFLGDTGGAMGLFAIGRQSFASDPYGGILPHGSYPDLSGIPVDQFRVLATLPQRPKPVLQLAESGCASFG